MHGEATIRIAAAPEAVYALVADVTRMGEWSPECVRAEWLGGATGAVVGARFKGWNRKGRATWSTTCTVTAAEPGRELCFENRQTTWRYRLALVDDGCEVTESFATRSYGPLSRILAPARRREPELVEGMRRTLERIKAAAEAGGA